MLLSVCNLINSSFWGPHDILSFVWGPRHPELWEWLAQTNANSLRENTMNSLINLEKHPGLATLLSACTCYHQMAFQLLF